MTTVEMEIVQGENWTTDVVWTDNFDKAINVVHPCKMTIKDATGAVLHTLSTNPNIPDGQIAGITLSSDLGLLQLHIEDETSAAFTPGQYQYDIFATVNADYGGAQPRYLFGGPFLVNKRITEL